MLTISIRKKLRDAVYGVTKADIRRLARRGGVKRISANIHEEIRRAMKAFMHKVLGESVALAELCGRKTVCASDIVFALRRQGHTLYVSEADCLLKADVDNARASITRRRRADHERPGRGR